MAVVGKGEVYGLETREFLEFWRPARGCAEELGDEHVGVVWLAGKGWLASMRVGGINSWWVRVWWTSSLDARGWFDWDSIA